MGDATSADCAVCPLTFSRTDTASRCPLAAAVYVSYVSIIAPSREARINANDTLNERTMMERGPPVLVRTANERQHIVLLQGEA